jgi:hypothetical protein
VAKRTRKDEGIKAEQATLKAERLGSQEEKQGKDQESSQGNAPHQRRGGEEEKVSECH